MDQLLISHILIPIYPKILISLKCSLYSNTSCSWHPWVTFWMINWVGWAKLKSGSDRELGPESNIFPEILISLVSGSHMHPWQVCYIPKSWYPWYIHTGILGSWYPWYQAHTCTLGTCAISWNPDIREVCYILKSWYPWYIHTGILGSRMYPWQVGIPPTAALRHSRNECRVWSPNKCSSSHHQGLRIIASWYKTLFILLYHCWKSSLKRTKKSNNWK